VAHARFFDALTGPPDYRVMEQTRHNDVAAALNEEGYGGPSPRELPGALTLSGALPATPEALDALTAAWPMRSDEAVREG